MVYEYLKLWLLLKADRRAVTALEYGMIAALIAATIVAAVTYLGNSVSNTFNYIASTVNSTPK